jgi:hypothetical protein
MYTVLNEVLAANQNYASSFGDKGKLPQWHDETGNRTHGLGGSRLNWFCITFSCG